MDHDIDSGEPPFGDSRAPRALFNSFINQESPATRTTSTALRAKFQSLAPFPSLASEIGGKVVAHLRDNEEWKLQRWALLDWLDRCLSRNTAKRMARSSFTVWENFCCMVRMGKVQAPKHPAHPPDGILLWSIKKDIESNVITAEEETTALRVDLKRGEDRIKELEALIAEGRRQGSGVQEKHLEQLEQAHNIKEEEHREGVRALEEEAVQQRMINDALAERMAELMVPPDLPTASGSGVQVLRIQDSAQNGHSMSNFNLSFNAQTPDRGSQPQGHQDAEHRLLSNPSTGRTAFLALTCSSCDTEEQHTLEGEGTKHISEISGAEARVGKGEERHQCPGSTASTSLLGRGGPGLEMEAKYLATWVCRVQSERLRKLDRSMVAVQARAMWCWKRITDEGRRWSRRGNGTDDDDDDSDEGRESVELLIGEVERHREAVGVLEAGLAACTRAGAEEKRAAKRAEEERSEEARKHWRMERLVLLLRVGRSVGRKRMGGILRKCVVRWWDLRYLRQRAVSFVQRQQSLLRRQAMAAWRRKGLEGRQRQRQLERRELGVARQAMLTWKLTQRAGHRALRDDDCDTAILRIRTSVRRIVSHLRGWQRVTARAIARRRASRVLTAAQTRGRLTDALGGWESVAVRSKVERQKREMGALKRVVVSQADELAVERRTAAEMAMLVEEGRRLLRERDGEAGAVAERMEQQQRDMDALSGRLREEEKRAEELAALAQEGRRQYVSKERAIERVEEERRGREQAHQEQVAGLENLRALEQERTEIVVLDLRERIAAREEAWATRQAEQGAEREKERANERCEWLARVCSRVASARSRRAWLLAFHSWSRVISARIRASHCAGSLCKSRAEEQVKTALLCWQHAASSTRRDRVSVARALERRCARVLRATVQGWSDAATDQQRRGRKERRMCEARRVEVERDAVARWAWCLRWRARVERGEERMRERQRQRVLSASVHVWVQREGREEGGGREGRQALMRNREVEARELEVQVLWGVLWEKAQAGALAAEEGPGRELRGGEREAQSETCNLKEEHERVPVRHELEEARMAPVTVAEQRSEMKEQSKTREVMTRREEAADSDLESEATRREDSEGRRKRRAWLLRVRCKAERAAACSCARLCLTVWRCEVEFQRSLSAGVAQQRETEQGLVQDRVFSRWWWVVVDHDRRGKGVQGRWREAEAMRASRGAASLDLDLDADAADIMSVNPVTALAAPRGGGWLRQAWPRAEGSTRRAERWLCLALAASLRRRGRAALCGWRQVVRARRVRQRNTRAHATRSRRKMLRGFCQRWQRGVVLERRRGVVLERRQEHRERSALNATIRRWRRVVARARLERASVAKGLTLRRARAMQNACREWQLWTAKMGRFSGHGRSKVDEMQARLRGQEEEMERRAVELEREKMVRTEGMRILERRIASRRQECVARELEARGQARALEQRTLLLAAALQAARARACTLHARARLLARSVCRLVLLCWRAAARCCSLSNALRAAGGRRAGALLGEALAGWKRELGSFDAAGSRLAQQAVLLLQGHKSRALLGQAVSEWARRITDWPPTRLPRRQTAAMAMAEHAASDDALQRKRAVAVAAKEWVQWQRVMCFEQRFVAQQGIRWINGLGLRAFCVWRGRASAAAEHRGGMPEEEEEEEDEERDVGGLRGSLRLL